MVLKDWFAVKSLSKFMSFSNWVSVVWSCRNQRRFAHLLTSFHLIFSLWSWSTSTSTAICMRKVLSVLRSFSQESSRRRGFLRTEAQRFSQRWTDLPNLGSFSIALKYILPKEANERWICKLRIIDCKHRQYAMHGNSWDVQDWQSSSYLWKPHCFTFCQTERV